MAYRLLWEAWVARTSITFSASDRWRWLECGKVIAVPTSVGYGTGLGGLAALMDMLNSCAAGLAVMNIDNGLGAAAFAYKVLRPDF